MAFQKAVKAKSKLRAAMFGPSGAGKTYSALAIGQGMGGRMALIDSERGSASKYAGRFEFDVQELQTKSVQEYISCIKEAASVPYDVLIIDSLSHAWETLNEQVEKIADAKYKGNFWAAWKEGTPEQRKLVDAIVSYPGHIIATMRSKTEWQTGGGDGGKSRPVRVGLAPEQGKGIEYEFDILFEMTPEHLAHIIKDRTAKFQDQIIEKPGEKFGKELIDWLNEGVTVPAKTTAPEAPQEPDIKTKLKNIMLEIKNIMEASALDGSPIFTSVEYDKVKAEIEGLKQNTPEQRLNILNRILADKKAILTGRLTPPEEPAAPAPAPAPAAPAAPAAKEPPRPLADNVPGTAQGAPTAIAPAAANTTTKPAANTPAAPQGAAPTTPAPLALGKPGALTAEFKKVMQEKDAAAAAAAAPGSLYNEPEAAGAMANDDGFEDDIPFQREGTSGTVPASELDIF